MKMAARKKLSRKIRFEVFKRDSFACIYCGRKAPEVILEIDHVIPVSENGSNDLLNLVTSCFECNRGKSNRQLSDNTIVEKSRIQLEELQAREEQRKMLVKWHKSLHQQDEQTIQEISKFWASLVPLFPLNEKGHQYFRKLINKFSLDEVLDAMRISVIEYVEYQKDEEGNQHPMNL